MRKRNLTNSNKKGCGITTVVRGIRAEQTFFDSCDTVANKENTNRNELIVRVVKEYCEKVLTNE